MNNSLDFKISMRNLVKFTMPSIVMMVITSVYTMVDGVFIARLVGTDAFSATNIVYPLLSITIGIGTMFGTGITAILSKKLGQGKQQEANQNFTLIIIFAIVTGVAFTAVCLVFLDKIIYALGSNDTIFTYCKEYIKPLILFFTINILQFIFQCVHSANGTAKLGLLLTILSGCANMVLDYIFIKVFNMGVAGAAVATGISWCVSTVFGLFYFTFNRKGNFYFVKPKWDGGVLLKTVTNGSSEMVGNLATSVTTFLFNIVIMKYCGQDGVAAVAVLFYLDFILVAISIGYSIGVSPLLGYGYGQNNREKLQKIYKLSVIISIGVGVITTAVSFIFAGQITSIFAPVNSNVFLLAVHGLRIYCFSYILKGFNLFSSALFTSFGNGKISAILSFFRTLVFTATLLIVMSILFNVSGIWLAVPLAELLSFIMAVVITKLNWSNYMLH